MAEEIDLAFQGIVLCVFKELAKDPKLGAAIKAGFGNAASSAEVLAMKMGGTKKGMTGSNVLEIIEDLRKITFED